MKRNYLLIFFTILSLNFVLADDRQNEGVSYYKAGFSQVAKPLLIGEIGKDASIQAEICYYLGNIYFEESKLDSAAYYFNTGLSVQPTYYFNTIGNIMLKMKSHLVGAELDIKNTLKIKGVKKNIDIMIAISRAYLMNGNIDKAFMYQRKAADIKSKYALAAVLLGDIYLVKKELGVACSNYEVAILYDENCKEAYIKYARAYKNVNVSLSIEMLNRLKQKEPNFKLVDKELADIYYNQNNFKMAAELYESYLQSGNSNVQDLTKYAMTLFLNSDFSKSLEVANLGIQKAPRNPAFNRLAMWNNVDLKQHENALKAADLFFNNTDSPDFTYLDYRYYGQALRDAKKNDLAILQFYKALEMDSTKVELWKDISDMYRDSEDYSKSIDAYSKYVSSLTDEKKTADVIMAFGKLHYNLSSSDSIAPSLKTASLIKADSLFAEVAKREPNGYRGNYWRARTNSALDPETTKGLAKPYYELTVALLEAKSDVTRYNSILIECYSYLGYYTLLQKDNALSYSYWNKILAIDPVNPTAKKAIEGIQKVLKKK